MGGYVGDGFLGMGVAILNGSFDARHKIAMFNSS